MYPASLAATRVLPPPPRLHWGIVLVLEIISVGLFDPVWLVVQANWVRRVKGKSRALPWAIAYLCALPMLFGAVIFVSAAFAFVNMQPDPAIFEGISDLFRLAVIGLRLLTVFTLRNELAEEPIRVFVGGGLTFFFGAIAFQYHLHDFNFDQSAHAAADGTLGLSN